MNYPNPIQKLIDLFAKFPTVGPKTAARFVFYLLNSKKEDVDELVEVISNLKKSVRKCGLCFNQFEPSFAKATEGGSPSLKEDKVCQICSDPRRDKSLLLVIEKETDLISIEKIKNYKGVYFILGGVISTLRKKDIEKVRVEQLKERVKRDSRIKEVIIATNPTSEGEATALYLERLLKPFNKKITRLGRGLPTGGELEYADQETLKSSLEGRK